MKVRIVVRGLKVAFHIQISNLKIMHVKDLKNEAKEAEAHAPSSAIL